MTTAAPTSPPQETTAAPASPPHDLLRLTITTAKAWALALTSYLGSLAALVGGYFGLKAAFPGWHDGLVVGVAAIPLALALLTITLPAWLGRRRDRKLVEEGISGTLTDPEYFRIWPYEASDGERYWRPDGAHEEVLRWLRAATSPVLYLTGRSGTGKSSLLNAWVLPKLKEGDPPYQTLVVRSYRDPLAELATALGRPRTIWDKPPADLPADPRARLERAAAYLGARQRLLIVLDQFEEFVILHEPERRARLEAFLHDLIARPIPNVTTLLVLRSDYLGALDQLGLPLLRQRDNWREIGPFTRAAAAAFLDRSGLKLGPELRAEILKEAGKIEENPGLIRPITLNMFGLVLSRFEGRLPRDFAAGRLLTSHLRNELNKREVREHAVAIVRHMVTDAGSKSPRSEADLAARTMLDQVLVRGCLLTLANGGLVRPLDEVNRVWEVAHDFVARLLAQVVGSWRTATWRRLRPWIAPASLVLWFGVLFVALPLYRAYVAEDHFRALRAMGVQVVARGDGFSASFAGAEDGNSLPRAAIPHLQKLDALKLHLAGTQVADAAPLANLTNLQRLDLEGTQVADAAPLAKLTNLQYLWLDGTKVADAAPLANLTSLQTLNLFGTQVADAAPLAKLTNLQSLSLAGTQVADAAPFANLTNLQRLDLEGTQVADAAPLANLTNLQYLNLEGTQVADAAPLANLTNLHTLWLSGTQVADAAPLTKLTNLQSLDLSGTQVADAAPLANLTNLQWLDLTGTKVADVAPLANLTNLQSLNLSRTQVADAAPLANLTNLQTLVLFDTQFSQGEVAELQRALAERGNRSITIFGP